MAGGVVVVFIVVPPAAVERMGHMSNSQGLVFQVKVRETLQVAPSSLGSGERQQRLGGAHGWRHRRRLHRGEITTQFEEIASHDYCTTGRNYDSCNVLQLCRNVLQLCGNLAQSCRNLAQLCGDW